MTRLGAPAVVSLLSAGLAVAAWPDLPLVGTSPAAGIVVAVLTAAFVVGLVDRRTPRRLVAVGVATLGIALALDAWRGARGTFTLTEGQGTRAFVETSPDGRALRLRSLADTLVLREIEPGGAVALMESDAQRMMRVSPCRAARAGGHRIGAPRVAGLNASGQRAIALSVSREPAALLAALGALVTMVGVAWSRW